MCAQAVPLIGKALVTDYAKAVGTEAFLGLSGSGMFCNAPFKLTSFTSGPVNDPEYSCPSENLPFADESWDSKYYSPLCRSWYKDQKNRPEQNTLSDLYLFASEPILGLTSCSPIVKQTAQKVMLQEDFIGALCLDIDPSGSLKDYFVLENDKYASYMMFNDDDIFQIDAFDHISDLEDSQFRTFIERIVGDRVKKAGDWDTVKVESLLAFSKRARIYDNKFVTWGVVDFTLTSESR